MAKDMRMLETKSRVGRIVDENVEENELMLELSIGGIYWKSNRNDERESSEKDVRPAEALNVVESKREIEAIRRRKREEKLKKSGNSCGSSVSGPFVEWLDEVLEMEPARKKERIGNSPENNHNVMPVYGGGEVVGGIDQCINRKDSVLRRAYEGNRNGKDVMEGRNWNVNSGGCGSDTQCSSRQGGATDDSRSNSINSQLDQQVPTTLAASHPSGQPTESSIPTPSTHKLTDLTVCNPGPLRPDYQFNPPDSSLLNPPSKPDPTTQQAAFLARMPCVLTTGNGPDGKTVSGFLYRYTKNEVSIMCVCHGRSFSPAGFVEHAGGVNIVHPLKHITIFPTAFAS